MSFIDVIQTPGRMLRKRVYKRGTTNGYLDDEEFVSVKTGYNFNIGDGTICRFMDLELKSDIGLTSFNHNISLYLYAKVEGGTEYSKSFAYYYPKTLIPEYDANTKTYIYKLCDSMILSMIPYVPVNVTYPTTCQTYFNALISALGWSTNVTLSVTGSMTLEEDIYDGLNLTYRDILNDLLQANGVVGYMSSNKYLSSRWLVPSSAITINDDILSRQNASVGKKFGPINSLTLSRSNGLDNISATDDSSIATYGLTNVTIADNILLSGENRGDYIQALFNKYKDKWYYLYDFELTGFGGIEPLSYLNISTNNNTYKSYCFNNEIEVDDGYKEVIYNTNDNQQVGTEYTYTNNDAKSDRNAEIIIDKKIGEVDIRGKAIKLTADDITIESNNFNVDSDGNLMCNEATMKGATFKGGDVTLYQDTSQTYHYPLRIYKNEIINSVTLNENYDLYRLRINYPSNNYLTNTETSGWYNFLKFENNDTELTYWYMKMTVSSHTTEQLQEKILDKNTNTTTENIIWVNQDNVISKTEQPSIVAQNLECTLYNSTYSDIFNRITYVLTTTNGQTAVNANSMYTKDMYLADENGNYYFYSLPTSGVTNTNMSIFALDNASFYKGSRDILVNKILWDCEGVGYYMNASQTATLSENVSKQPHGIVLVWSAYANGAVQNYNWHCDFVPKQAVALANSLNGNGFSFQMASSKFTNIATKYVYIHDDRVVGNADNNATGTSTGTNIKYANNTYVLRYVIGV